MAGWLAGFVVGRLCVPSPVLVRSLVGTCAYWCRAVLAASVTRGSSSRRRKTEEASDTNFCPMFTVLTGPFPYFYLSIFVLL